MSSRPVRRFALAAVALACAAGAHAQAPATAYPLPPPDWPRPVHDTAALPFVLLDRLEYARAHGDGAWVWDAQGWYGGDYDKLWIKAEGDKESGGRTQDSSLEALYARRVLPFWYLQAGVRAEERPGPRRTFAVIGIQGIAPEWFDVQAEAFAQGNGSAGARLEAENNFYFTQRLILQPRGEVRFASRRDPQRGLGSGLTQLELGLRLRYELKRELAPYIGIAWTRRFGETADFARAAGGEARTTALVLGARLWY